MTERSIMPKTRIALGSMPAAILLAGCSGAPNLYADTPAGTSISIIVLEADALVIDDRPVRLSNAVAPQLAPRAHCWAEALAARQARDAVQSLVVAAREVSATPTGGMDEYNRAYSRITVDGVDLGLILLQGGMAIAPSKVRFEWCGPVSAAVARGPSLSALTRDGG